MDPLTHTLTGLALSRAGLNRLTAHATPILLVAANAPDLDIVTLAGGTGEVPALPSPPHALTCGRAVHGAVTRCCSCGSSRGSRSTGNGPTPVALAGVLYAPAARLDERLRRSLAAAVFRRLVPARHREPAGSLDLGRAAAGRGRAAVVTPGEFGDRRARRGRAAGSRSRRSCFMVLYSFGRYLLHERALAVLDSRLYDGAAPSRVPALARPGNPFALARHRGDRATSTRFTM